MNQIAIFSFSNFGTGSSLGTASPAFPESFDNGRLILHHPSGILRCLRVLIFPISADFFPILRSRHHTAFSFKVCRLPSLVATSVGLTYTGLSSYLSKSILNECWSLYIPLDNAVHYTPGICPDVLHPHSQVQPSCYVFTAHVPMSTPVCSAMGLKRPLLGQGLFCWIWVQFGSCRHSVFVGDRLPSRTSTGNRRWTRGSRACLLPPISRWRAAAISLLRYSVTWPNHDCFSINLGPAVWTAGDKKPIGCRMLWQLCW